MAEQIEPLLAVLSSIRAWSSLADLASFAAARRGFGDTNGGFGVTYPGDLDEYDRVVDGVTIPNGFVEVYGHWGPPNGYKLLIRESFYLEALAGVLTAKGLHLESARVKAIQEDTLDA